MSLGIHRCAELVSAERFGQTFEAAASLAVTVSLTRLASDRPDWVLQLCRGVTEIYVPARFCPFCGKDLETA